MLREHILYLLFNQLFKFEVGLLVETVLKRKFLGQFSCSVTFIDHNSFNLIFSQIDINKEKGSLRVLICRV